VVGYGMTNLADYFPNGYTVVCPFGKTRTYYSMLKKLADKRGKTGDPGKMDVKEYASMLLPKYGQHMNWLKARGVTDIILTMLHYEAWQSRGSEYISQMLLNLRFLIAPMMVEIYDQGYTPYFIGLDMVFKFYKEGSEEHAIASEMVRFQEDWQHKAGNVYLGIEMFPVTSHTILENAASAPDTSSAKDPVELEKIIYEWKSKLLCNGRVLPQDGFLLASNYNGDLRIRSSLAAELLVHHKRFKLFYYPGPSLMMPESAYERIFTDIVNASKAKMRSTKIDYAGMKTDAQWATEIEYAQEVADDPSRLVGLLR
jgi:hypothetical protein